MKYKILFVSISILLIRSDCQEAKGITPHDLSFRQFCEEVVQGRYLPMPDKLVIDGDQCNFTLSIASQNDKEAGRFCRQWAPYRTVNAKSKDGKTNCLVETTLACPDGKIQIHEKCYAYLRNQDDRFTYENAESACKSKGAEIATLRRVDLPRLWNAFFKNMYQIWVKIPDGVHPNFVYENGDRAAIVYGNAIGYRTKMGSLIKLGNKAVSSVMCQWEPTKTDAEHVRQSKELLGIYHMAVKNNERLIVPSSNRYGHDSSSKLWQTKVCQRAMKTIQASHPQQAFGGIVNLQASFTHGIVVGRAAPYRWEDSPEKRKTSECYQFLADIGKIGLRYTYEILSYDGKTAPGYSYRPEWDNSNLKREHFDECDQFLSSAYVQRSQVRYWTMSDAFRAPIFCHVSYEQKTLVVEEPGWTRYDRSSGQIVWHQKGDTSNNYNDAVKACEEKGAYLSGFETEEEYQQLKKLCKAEFCWLGAVRKPICRWSSGGKTYDDDPNSECSKTQIFEWQNGVARNGNASILANYWALNDDDHEQRGRKLDYYSYNENCLELLTRGNHLNDCWCNAQEQFLCQKFVRTVVV